jgi:hypothetical protein
MECCTKRNDFWGSEVMNHLQDIRIDLVAVYHDNCLSRLLLHKQLDTKHPKILDGTVIRKKNEVVSKALYLWLESEAGAEMYALSELHAKMAEFSGGSDINSIKRFKQKLQEHYILR